MAVGLFYGLIMLENKHREDVLYMVGKWNYREKRSIGFLLLAIIVIAVIPAGLFALLIPALTDIAILNFICVCVGALWASFALVYPLCWLQNKYRWIAYEENGTE